MLLAYSWPMRWNTRSAPERSTRAAIPGNLASNAFAIFSASGRSTEVYQTTLPSFLAASISAGVIALAGGAADSTWVENVAPAASALEPISRSRRENFEPFIGVSSIALILLFRPREIFLLYAKCTASVGPQVKPHGTSLRNVFFRCGDHAQLRAVLDLNHIVPAAAEKDLPHHGGRHDVFRLLRLFGGNRD